MVASLSAVGIRCAPYRNCTASRAAMMAPWFHPSPLLLCATFPVRGSYSNLPSSNKMEQVYSNRIRSIWL